MPGVIGYIDVCSTREQLGTSGGETWCTWFLNPPRRTREPQAYIVEYAAGRPLGLHYHDADEFQVVLAGSGTMGQHELRPGVVHFARAYTGYGPIVAGPNGLSVMTLRAERDSSGPQFLPDKLDALRSVQYRRPWQAWSQALFDEAAELVVELSFSQTGAGPGFGGYLVIAPPRKKLNMPECTEAKGHYALLLEGSAFAEGREHQATAIEFAPAGQVLQSWSAGNCGARVLLLRFPSAPD